MRRPLMPRTVKRYGWIPDLPDHRDQLFAAPSRVLAKLPTSVDLRSKCPPEIYDQRELGSCTANAIRAAIELMQLKGKLPKIFTASRRFIYYSERLMEGTVDTDPDALSRDGVKSVAKQGA